MLKQFSPFFKRFFPFPFTLIFFSPAPYFSPSRRTDPPPPFHHHNIWVNKYPWPSAKRFTQMWACINFTTLFLYLLLN